MKRHLIELLVALMFIIPALIVGFALRYEFTNSAF